MSTARAQALAALAAAQAKVDALTTVPETDEYPVGTIIRWKVEREPTRVSIKINTATWHTTGLRPDTYPTWQQLAASYWSQGVELFEVAPAMWTDAREYGDESAPPMTREQLDTPVRMVAGAVMRIAADLHSEHDENPEYDRALVELAADVTGWGSQKARVRATINQFRRDR